MANVGTGLRQHITFRVTECRSTSAADDIFLFQRLIS